MWLGALSVMLSVAVRVPATVGLNVTLITQVPFGAIDAGHLLAAKSAPSAPAIATDAIVRLMFPLLVSVTLFATLVMPTVSFPNVMLLAESLAMAPRTVWLKTGEVLDAKSVLPS